MKPMLIKLRSGSRLIAPVLAFLAAGTVAVVSTTVAHAEEVRTQDALLAEEKRDRLSTLMLSGADEAEIERLLNLEKVPQPAGGVGALSESTAVSVGTPSIYYDRDIRKYHAYAGYSWKNLQTNGDNAGSGNDAFAIRFTKDVVNHGVRASFCPGQWRGARPYPALPACITPQPEDNGAKGASFKFKDYQAKHYCGGTDAPSCFVYVGAVGNITFTFDTLSSGCLQTFSKYGHTWSSVSITGVSVSNNSISFNFSGTSNRWDVSSSNSGKLGC